MSFKHFLQLNEWFTFPYDTTKQELKDLKFLQQQVKEKHYYKAELLLDKLNKRFLRHLKDVLLLPNSENKNKELLFTKQFLNKLHDINIKTKEIRNVKTTYFETNQ